MSAPVRSPADRFLDRWDVRSRHEIDVDAPAESTYRAVRGLDLGRSLPVSVLFGIRGIPHLITGKARFRRELTLDALLEFGFVTLEEQPGRELVLGAVGRFWRPTSGFEPFDPADFAAFSRPGFAKATFDFTLEERGARASRLATETRVWCTDGDARRKFLLYWRFIGPFSGAIRLVLLRQVKRAAEASA